MRNRKLAFAVKIMIFLWGGFGLSVWGQEIDGKTITLNETLEMAVEHSLEAFKTKRQYGSGFWKYRSFKAKHLPKVDFDLQPFTFNRSFVKRYDPENNIDVYRQQQNLNTYAQLSLSQNVMATGATVYLNSSFDRLENFGDSSVENYSTTPVRIGLMQPLMAYNELKWEDRTAELEYEKAKKTYLAQQQDIRIKATSFFFQWALADIKLTIARENQKNALRIYKIGKKRYTLGTIERDELLNLELETFTAGTYLARTAQELQAVISQLQLFLDRDDLSEYTPRLPEVIPSLKVGMEEARELVSKNNPELLAIRIRRINAERDLDRAVKENRFDLSINASYGLNQQAENFAAAYSNFLDQQLVAIQFSMPLLDWGERKGNIKTAQMDKEVADIEIEQAENDIWQQLTQKVNNFNLQEELVQVALYTKVIAQESYAITEKRFLSGKVDLIRLLSAREAWQSASEGYVRSLQDYWEFYYGLQQLTLYDFGEGMALGQDFDALLKD